MQDVNIEITRSIRRLGGTRMLCLYRTCWTIRTITFLLKNLVSNTTLQSTFCITISSSLPFPHILKARHPLIRTLGILKGLCQLESMRSEVMQITFNCQNSIVFNAWLSPCALWGYANYFQLSKFYCFFTVAHRGHATYIFISRDKNTVYRAINWELSRDKFKLSRDKSKLSRDKSKISRDKSIL